MQQNPGGASKIRYRLRVSAAGVSHQHSFCCFSASFEKHSVLKWHHGLIQRLNSFFEAFPLIFPFLFESKFIVDSMIEQYTYEPWTITWIKLFKRVQSSRLLPTVTPRLRGKMGFWDRFWEQTCSSDQYFPHRKEISHITFKKKEK